MLLYRSGLKYPSPIAELEPPKPSPNADTPTAPIACQVTSLLAEPYPKFVIEIGEREYKYSLPDGSMFRRTLARFVKKCWPYLPKDITGQEELGTLKTTMHPRLAPRITMKSVTKAGNHINLYYYPQGSDKTQQAEPKLVVEVNCLRFEGTAEEFKQYTWLAAVKETGRPTMYKN